MMLSFILLPLLSTELHYLPRVDPDGDGGLPHNIDCGPARRLLPRISIKLMDVTMAANSAKTRYATHSDYLALDLNPRRVVQRTRITCLESPATPLGVIRVHPIRMMRSD